MCGIVAVFCGDAVTRVRTANECLDRIVHRGSTGERGVDNEPTMLPVTLGTNRLPIVGGSAGTQPAHSRSGNIFCVHNGEVYNAGALADRIRLRPPESVSDTRVLSELIDMWGIDRTLEEIEWEGSLVAIDSVARMAFVARDHLGIKPLYYAKEGRSTVFASEVKALSWIGTEIKEVGAGTVITFPLEDPDLAVSRQWWSPDAEGMGPRSSSGDDVADSIEYAVQSRVPNEPYAVLLSGGLDSSLVLRHALAKNANATAFVLKKDGSDDLAAARRLSADFGVPLVEVEGPSGTDLWKSAREVVRIVESWEWHVVNHAAPMLSLMSAIKDMGFRVALTGEGADELFCGYNEISATGRRLETNPDLTARRLARIASLGRTNCQRVDRISMHYTIECRVPFLDKRVAETALSLAPRAHLQGGVTKYLLKEAARNLLPDYILNRPKLSFAKGAGYIYGDRGKAGVFDVPLEYEYGRSVRDAASGYGCRFPVEEIFATYFVEHGYGQAKFMTGGTV